MTRLFEPDGRSVPVTVIRVDAARVLDHRTKARDGHDAIRLVCGEPARQLAKSQAGQLRKAGLEACGSDIHEVEVVGKAKLDGEALAAGKEVTVEMVFSEGERVDVLGTSKGKGFAGTIKRYNFSAQDSTHGNSLSHRIAGTTGQNQLPGRVFPGKKMPGHMGAVKVCKQNLSIVRIVPEEGLILVRGSIPGHNNARVTVRKSQRGTRD